MGTNITNLLHGTRAAIQRNKQQHLMRALNNSFSIKGTPFLPRPLRQGSIDPNPGPHNPESQGWAAA